MTNKQLTERQTTAAAPKRGAEGESLEIQANSAPQLHALPVRQTKVYPQMRRNVRFAAAVFLALIIGVAGLLTQINIAGAVISSGVLVIEGGQLVVQHPDGGIISAININEGDDVEEGELLITLDDTVVNAMVSAAASGLVNQQARLARLEAERDNLDQIDFADLQVSEEIPKAEYAAILASESRQFQLRRDERNGQRDQLLEREQQFNDEIQGRLEQHASLKREESIVRGQLSDMRDLLSQNLVTRQKVVDLERLLSQLGREMSELSSANAQTAGRISELKIAILQIDQTLRADLTDQFASVKSAIAQSQAQLASAKVKLAQTKIFAPRSGRVLGLAVNTIGGVAAAGQTLLTIVPNAESVVGEVRLRPADIDNVYPGQEAVLNFSAFDRGTTPSLDGHLENISADLVREQQTGTVYYIATVEIEPNQLEKLGDLRLVPGMPIEVFIRTNSRTIASYLTKPLLDQFRRSFR